MHASIRPELRRCIEHCLQCYQACQSTLMGHCVESGGRHLEPDHVRLMSTCAEMCRAAAHAMLSQASIHPVICGACAETCERCAASCDAIGDMDECATACRACAASCREMSGAASPGSGTGARKAASRAAH